MEPHEVDTLIRQLVTIAVHQGTINTDLRTCIQELQGIAADTRTTLARIETLLARMLERSANGRDA